MARRARSGSGSPTSSFSWRGTICHDSPNRSLSHPQGPGSPPSAVSTSHIRSTSAWSSHSMTNETASLKPKSAPHPGALPPVLALEHERNRLVEAEVRPAVEALEVLAVEREVDRQDHPGRPAGRVGGGGPTLAARLS